MAKKSEILEVIQNLNSGVRYSNEVAGWSYSKGATMMKIDAKGNMRFYTNEVDFAKAILKSIKTGA